MLRVWLCCLCLVLAGCCVGCRWLGVSLPGRECRAVGVGQVPVPAPPPPAHPEHQRLLAYRNYYSITRVGEYEHHFAVGFHCIEGAIEYYAVSAAGTVRTTGGFWGPLPMQDGAPAPVPADQIANASAVRDRHAAAYDGESRVHLWYLGSYREVEVSEVVPMAAPGDPYKRMVGQATAVLRASADLTTFSGFASFGGGGTFQCWRDLHVRDCGEQSWIDFTPSIAGTVQLPSLISPRSPLGDGERARFAAAVLAGARRRAAGEAGAPLDEILAGQGDSLLPAGLSRPFVVEFKLFARPMEMGKGDQAEVVLSTTLSVRDALEGVARGVARGQIANVGVVAEVELSADGPQPPGVQGELQVPLRLRYQLGDNRGNRRSGEIALQATVLLDGEASAVQARTFPGGVMDHTNDPPVHQSLPGVGTFRAIDAYLGVQETAAVATWWP